MKTKETAFLATLSISNLALAFGFQWYMVTYIGSGWQTDAVFAALVVPNLILAVVSSSLTHVLVPIFSARKKAELEKSAWMFFYLIGFFFIAFSILLVASDSLWLPILLPGFSDKAIELTTNLFEIQVIGIVGISLVGVLEAVSHAKLKFYNIEIIKNLVGMVALCALFITISDYGVYAAAVIFSLRPLLSVLLMIRHLGHWQKPSFSLEEVKTVWIKLKYLILGTAYYKTDPLLDKFLLSMTTSGSITLFHIAQQIYGAASSIMNRAISVPLVPVLARYARQEDWKQFKSEYFQRLVITIALCLVAVIGIFSMGEFTLELLFEYRRFSESSVEKMWHIMIALSGMFIAGTIGQVLASSFYAHGNTRIPTRIGIIGYTLGIALKIIVFYFYGLIGVASAASIYYTINAIALYFSLEQQINRKQEVL